jgi:hypothetical protein
VLALRDNPLTDITPLAKFSRGLKRILRVDKHHEHPANDPVLAVLKAHGCHIHR